MKPESKEPRSVRRLFVGWQDKKARSFIPVASLVQVKHGGDGFYRFAYLRRARTAPHFEPFASFPDFGMTYDSVALFPFFSNRVMSRKRTDFPAMMHFLDLNEEAEPFEILARSGGRRETDHLEVFPEPERDPTTARGQCLFFARGLRYFPGSEEAITALHPGTKLRLLLDIQNPVNPSAALLMDDGNRTLGYVPDYLVAHLGRVLHDCGAKDVEVTVEHVNAVDSPRNLRLMCRLTSCWPKGYVPFTDDDFQPIVKGALLRSVEPQGGLPRPGANLELPIESWS